MNNTALSAGLLSASGTCLATTEVERRLLSASGTCLATTEVERRLLSAGGTCLATTEAERRLLSASGICLATTEVERRLRSTHKERMFFANEEHEKFYYENLGQARHLASLSGILQEIVINPRNPCRNEREEEC